MRLATPGPEPAPVRGGAFLLLILLFLALTGCGTETEPSSAAATDSLPMLSRIARPVEGGDVHLVRLVQRGDRYAFEPAEIQILPGDVIRFVMVGGQPESVVFDTVGSSPEVAEYVRGHDMSEGVLLTEPGDARDFRFDEAPPGRYPFHSIPHAGQGMRGTVIVREPS